MAKRKSVKDKNKELTKDDKALNHFGIVLRIYPNQDQEVLINKTFGCSRFVYNKYLIDRQAYFKENKKTLSASKYKKDYFNPMKQTKEYNFLKEVDKFALEVALESVEDAYTRFFSMWEGKKYKKCCLDKDEISYGNGAW